VRGLKSLALPHLLSKLGILPPHCPFQPP